MMSRNTKAFGRRELEKSRLGVGSKLRPLKYCPRFLGELGNYDNQIQKSLFSRTERSIFGNIFNGSIDRVKYDQRNGLQRANIGKYLHNRISNSSFISSNGKYIPYPHMNSKSKQLFSIFELILKCDLFIISSFKSPHHHLLYEIKKICHDRNVYFEPVKPILLQACLWKLSQKKPENFDDFWLQGHTNTYSDELFNKLRFSNPETKSSLGWTTIYALNINSSSHSVLEEVFSSKYMENQCLLGAHFSPTTVGSSEKLRLISNNISFPWESKGGNGITNLANVFKELASKGLIHSSQSGCNGLYLLP